MAKDKQDILQRLDSAHLRLDAKIDGLERKTQQQLLGLQRTVDSLGLESSAAGLQRVRNSIVLADPGHATPPLPSLDLASDSTTSHSRYGSSDASAYKRNGISEAKTNGKSSSKLKTATVHSASGGGGATATTSSQMKQQPDEVQYTLDKLGLDASSSNNGGGGSSSKQLGLQALRNRLALTRIREQKELDAIVEHYERRNHISSSSSPSLTNGGSNHHHHHNGHHSMTNGGGGGAAVSVVVDDDDDDVEQQSESESEEEEEEEEEEDEMSTQLVLPPILSSQKATPMASDSRYLYKN